CKKWTHPSPTGARTNFLRTLSKINHLRSLSNLAPHGVSPEGAAHYTAVLQDVNTSFRPFFTPAGGLAVEGREL
ncbi:MAG: hypothetical protein K0M64_01090, partial [Rhizobium sp.]|nr:hypothetical protein [Rhizobium sp.]